MKIIEFDKVYLEVPNVMKKEEVEIEEKESTIISLSTEELKRRLEETQSLHL